MDMNFSAQASNNNYIPYTYTYIRMLVETVSCIKCTRNNSHSVSKVTDLFICI